MGNKHEHFWVSLAEIKAMNLDNCKGETGPIDMFVMPSRVPEGLGTVCIGCFQIWGEAAGVLEPSLVAFEKIMRSY